MKRLFFLMSVFSFLLTSCTSSLKVKVISFNLRNSSEYASNEDGENCWANRRDAQIAMVNQEKPDLLGVQECLSDQDEFFLKNLSGYGRIGVGRDDGDREGEMMTIYYNTERFDLVCSGNFWLSETPDSVSRGWDGICNRMVTWGCFQLKGTDKQIFHFNTHLDVSGLIAREQGSKLLASRIKSIVPDNGKGAPFVITGDFNAVSSDTIFNPILEIANDTRKQSPVTDNKMTYNGYGKYPEFVVDHIFEANLKPVCFKTLDDNYGVPYISDHYPVSAILEFDVSKEKD